MYNEFMIAMALRQVSNKKSEAELAKQRNR